MMVFSLVTSDLKAQEDDYDDEPDVSREALLAPVISRLTNQARQEEPLQTVSVSGAVRAPGVYPLFENATVKALLDAAGGLTDSAYLNAAELRRLITTSDGAVVPEYKEINLSATADDLKASLRTRDHITVRRIPDWTPSDSIEIEGEVRFPGEYRIRKGETLSDLVNRAGGLSDSASLDSAIFMRRDLAAQETQRAAEFAEEIQTTYARRLLTEEVTSQSMEEISLIVESLKATKGTGRLMINLPGAMSKDADFDLEVRNGDRLVIPKLSNTVAVVGEVKRRGTHTFSTELSVQDYIDLSAGLTPRADKQGIYIIRANGSVEVIGTSLWQFSDGDVVPKPGDTVVVPINSQYKDSLASWTEITQIVYQSIVALAAVARL